MKRSFIKKFLCLENNLRERKIIYCLFLINLKKCPKGILVKFVDFNINQSYYFKRNFISLNWK
jgi:hypothetical protein